MIRRNFLSLMGAAIAAPALPPIAVANPASVARAAIPRAFPYGLATFYARHNPTVSVGKLAKYVNVTPKQAEGLIAHLVRDQRLVASGVPGMYRTTSPAPHPQSAEIKRTVKSKAKTRRIRAQTPQAHPTMHAYLRDMAQNYFAAKQALL